MDQLRRNLHAAQLRESVHRPHYPSPLRRSPLQASISSASHTAASVASSSCTTVSTSTTPPSTSSRFSINQAFKDLTDDDIDFFDRLVNHLPHHAADFSQLKTAYAAHVAEELSRRNRHGTTKIDWDAHLWSILLSLVKVRGRNWRERWDSVRLAFGLDPNSGDETDQSAVTQSTNITATSDSTQHLDGRYPDREVDDSYRQYVRAARHTSGLPADRTPRRSDQGRPILPPHDRLLLPRASSPPQMPHSSHRASPRSYPLDDPDERPEATPQARSHAKDPISAIQARLSRLLDPESSADGSSDSDSPDLAVTARSALPIDVASPGPSSRLPTDAKRRFDELVRSSQSERSKLRQSNMQMQEREELERWSEQLDMADQWQARRLLQMCLAWWITLTRQQLEKTQNAADASDRVTIDKAWERWRVQTRRESDVRHTGAKTDRVRCSLTAFRRWKTRMQTLVERKEELKKESMRTAYYATSNAVKARLLVHAFSRWKINYRERLADSVRRRHLQAGAFALWQMRSSHNKQLQAREKMMTAKRNLLALEALHTWRKMAMLSRLSQAFAERRLKLATIDGWQRALEQRQQARKQEVLAVRWRMRRLKQNTLTGWQRHRQQIAQMEGLAVNMQKSNEQAKLQSAFHRWQLLSRAALLERVHTAGRLEIAFHEWKHHHLSLTTSLQQRETAVVQRRDGATMLACLRRWRHLTNQIRHREAEVEARRNETLRSNSFITWRQKQLEHRLLHQKSVAVSDFFTLRSAFQRWRSQLRKQRADSKEATHNRRLVQQVYEIWRARSDRQRHLANLLQLSLANSDQALARSYLNRWVARIIEVRSRELEVKEQREKRLVKTAFYAWIEACLRHDDLLALMNSYIDVKEEDRKKRTFSHWLAVAREHKERREKAEMLAASTRKKMLVATLTAWRDKLRDRALATQEYDMLILRQQLSLKWAINTWKSQTLLLPAIRMRNTSLKRQAFQQWQRNLPNAQLSNRATRILRTRFLGQSWQAWREKLKTRRQLRAAARFGAGTVSVQRLRTLSAAAAANRSAGSSSPSAQHSSSPFRALPATSTSPYRTTPVRRPKTSLALVPPLRSSTVERDIDARANDNDEVNVRQSRQRRSQAEVPRRSLSVPRQIKADLVSETDDTPHHAMGTGSDRFVVPESPSKEAASRRSRTVPKETTPTTASRATIKPQTQSGSESQSRTRRSAKYDQALSLRPRVKTMELNPPLTKDSHESGDSVQSAPVSNNIAGQSRPKQRSLAVAEDMILQLRARSRSRRGPEE
ncbi:uncharacterized protein UBRO2_04563 [Ustilago bromivora]|uniref:Sfi1 spindle body domain-containing protein n=1 Tax=Ustilago bromivora TaxID=307758 RepID=A0A8H8QPY1_9BASI|nr:uncharacterized protein UBRO2_04563 [Ustilago bromivora]